MALPKALPMAFASCTSRTGSRPLPRRIAERLAFIAKESDGRALVAIFAQRTARVVLLLLLVLVGPALGGLPTGPNGNAAPQPFEHRLMHGHVWPHTPHPRVPGRPRVLGALAALRRANLERTTRHALVQYMVEVAHDGDVRVQEQHRIVLRHVEHM